MGKIIIFFIFGFFFWMNERCALHFTGPPGSEVDDLGFRRPWNLDLDEKSDEYLAARAYSDFWSQYLPTLVRRRKRWEKVDPRTHPLLMQRFIHKGIPSTFRKEIWFRNCPPRGQAPSTSVPRSVVEEIRLDLPRTFPDNIRLRNTKSQNVLGRILYELAAYVPSIGYCQGLNFIAALLWLVLEDEEKIKPRSSWYGSDMGGLRRDMRVLYELLRKEVPVICSTLNRLDVGLDLLIGKWFLCWFLEVLPMETVLRVWDCFIYEGDVWFFRVAIRLLRLNATRIAACRTMDELLTTIQSIGPSKYSLKCHLLIQGAMTEKISQDEVDRLRDIFGRDFT